MDCRLTSGLYELRLLPKTVAWTDGTWHTVDRMPLKGDAAAWEKVEFKFLGGWPILQLWLWEKTQTETQIESLHWFVTDAENRKFTIITDGVVRKRRLELAEPVTEVTPGPSQKAAKPKKVPPPKYLYDAWEPHSLKAVKDGSLEWQLSTEKKIIKKQTSENR